MTRRELFKMGLVAPLGLVTMHAEAQEVVMGQNYVSNGRFSQWREPFPVHIPTAAKWFPEAWRIAPGPGTAVASLYDVPATVSDGYGRVLYAKFDNYNPFPEPGRAFLTSHAFEFDEMIGQTLRMSWWQRLDKGTVGVVPMLMVNYVNGDYEFWGADQYLICTQDDVNWPQQTAKDPAGYRARIQGAPAAVATTQWQECTAQFVLPDGAGHVLSNKRHVSVNLNFSQPTAPGIHITHVRLERL
jgi:hypothetical protein